MLSKAISIVFVTVLLCGAVDAQTQSQPPSPSRNMVRTLPPTRPSPTTASSSITKFTERANRFYSMVDDRIARLDESGWQRKTQLLVNDKVMREGPLGELLWFMFFDAIHHRGQLSTYVRPMGGQVPSIYGPSGDDPGS